MNSTTKRGLKLSAFGAAAALAMGGVFVQTASATTTEVAPTSGSAYDALALDLLASDPALVAVGKDANDQIVVSYDGELSAETKKFVDANTNVIAQEMPRLGKMDTNEVVGGAGYAINQAAVCSVGFPGFDAQGEPVVITAGHCGEAGDKAERTVPSGDDASGSEQPTIWDDLGTFEFSQWGGPGSNEGGADLNSTDIAAIKVTNDALVLRPEITDWTTWQTEDLAASTTPVTAVGTASVGQQVSKSGRTTGLTSGEVVQVDTWANVCEDPDNGVGCHAVHGFVNTAKTIPGDSGGAVFSGTTALGVVSGGNDQIMFAADLPTALNIAKGYTLMLDIAEPTVTSPVANGVVAPGGAITGTAPAGSTVKVTIDGVTAEVAVGSAGTWSITAPGEEGDYTASIVAVSGFNTSETVTHPFTVERPALAAPAITTPATGTSVTGSVKAISGTGVAGATVTLSGDAEGTATVAADGTWSVAVDLGIGSYTVTAAQALDGQTSASVTSSFKVVPAAPAITSPTGGDVAASAAPKAVSGTGIEGAQVTVTVDGTALEPVLVVNGEWTVALPAALAVGSHTISAVQSVDGLQSAPTSVTVNVVADATPSPTPAPPGGGGGGGDDELPQTGMDTGAALTGAILGIGAIAAAGVLLTIARMRAKTAALNESAE